MILSVEARHGIVLFSESEFIRAEPAPDMMGVRKVLEIPEGTRTVVQLKSGPLYLPTTTPHELFISFRNQRIAEAKASLGL